MELKIDAGDAVLLIIDIQDRLADIMEEKENLYKNTNILIKMARRFGMEVMVTEQYPKGLGFTSERLDIDRGTDFIEEKLLFSAYTDNVKLKLASTGKKTVIVTGIEAHICVFQSVRDLCREGYKVFAVRDAVCSRNEKNKENGLYLMDKAGAIITNTETVLYDVLNSAENRKFKELSKLIK